MSENPVKIEQEIAELEKTLAEKKAALENEKGEEVSEKDALRQVIKEKIQEKPTVEQKISRQEVQPIEPEAPEVEAPSYLSEELKPKVQEFVNIAFNKSLEEAIKTVKATKNPALIDAFHDVIVDELYNYLIERGKLKKVT